MVKINRSQINNILKSVRLFYERAIRRVAWTNRWFGVDWVQSCRKCWFVAANQLAECSILSSLVKFWFILSFSYSTKSSNTLGQASASSYEPRSSPMISAKFRNMFQVSRGMPRMSYLSSRNWSHRRSSGGSRIVNTSFQRSIAMSTGRILWPDDTSKPKRNVNLYKSLKSSPFTVSSRTISGSCCWIPRMLSTRMAFSPPTNSCRVNWHICSAFNFHANTRTLNSSGESCKSSQSLSMPSAKMRSSSGSCKNHDEQTWR